jgi:hypothetical protein
MHHERGIRQADIANTLHPSRVPLGKIPRRVGIGGESKHSAVHAGVIGERINGLLTGTGTAAARLRLQGSTAATPAKHGHGGG